MQCAYNWETKHFRKAMAEQFFGPCPLTFRQTDSPAVIMDDDGDMVRVIEGCGAALERRIIEAPFRRSKLPDERTRTRLRDGQKP
jgi:hypothetical protein